MFYEPNVILPLAASYNTRGIDGHTNLVTNGLDQRKINLVYRPVKNALTGQTTLYLCKRPGMIIDPDNASFGTTGQVAYLVGHAPDGYAAESSFLWLYSVSGNDVRASSSTTTTVVLTSAGKKPLYVDHFNVGGTDTVVLQIGTNHVLDQTAWYSTAIATWNNIEAGDSDFPPVIGKMEFVDGYAFAAMASASVQRIYNSDLNSISSWTSTNYITKQIQQDFVQGLMRIGNLIIAAGHHTFEVFRNAGNASGSPLESVQHLAQNVGIYAHHAPYYCTVRDRIYFYSRRGPISSIAVSSYDGARVENVSTPNIEAIIGSLISTTGVQGIYTINFQGRQAVACVLTAVTASTQRALLFFPDYNEWFEWTSTVFCPSNSSSWFLGVGANQHKVYTFPTSDTWQDNATDYDATMQFALPANGNHRKFMRHAGLKGDTTSSAINIAVKKKDNDEAAWVTLGAIDLSTPYKVITRGGSWRGQRQIQLVNSANNEGRMESFLARID